MDARTHPLIGSAEFALIGEVPPRLRKPEGPFGDHYGYYSLQHDYPVFQVKQLAHRADAIYPATVVGKPRQEDFFIGDLLQELLSPLFPLVMPAVEQLWSYGETGYHSLSAAVVKQRYKREAIASAFRILGEGQLSLTKFLLVTDRHVDLKNFRATLEHVLARTNPETDLYVFSNLSMDTLDYTGPDGERRVQGRVAWPRRSRARAAAPVLGDAAVRRDAGRRVLWRLPGGERPAYADEPQAASRLARDPAFADWPLVVLSDDAGAGDAERDELPLDDVHPVRAWCGHRIRGAANRAQPHRPSGADRHRRTHEADLPEGAVLRRGHGEAGERPLARVLPVAERGDGRFGQRASRLRQAPGIGAQFTTVTSLQCT